MTLTSKMEVGQRITAGNGEDRDSGIVDSINGDQVTVRWDSGIVTTQSIAALSPMSRTATDVLVYWDSQDKSNEGWAYRVSAEHSDIESGSIDDLDDDADSETLRNRVATIALEHGVEIEAQDVECNLHQDGGWARWSA